MASTDGLRFVEPIRTVNAGFNRGHFPARGVSWLNHMTDRFTEFHRLIVPGTLHDSPYVLEGLLDSDNLIPLLTTKVKGDRLQLGLTSGNLSSPTENVIFRIAADARRHDG